MIFTLQAAMRMAALVSLAHLLATMSFPRVIAAPACNPARDSHRGHSSHFPGISDEERRRTIQDEYPCAYERKLVWK